MRRIWLVAIAILVVGAGGFAAVRLRRDPAASDRMRTARVTRGTVVLSVSATGTVQPASLVEVRSRATGTVTRVRVDEGQSVTAGEVLVEIDDPDARAAVESARASLRSAEAATASARARLDALRAGATVYARQQAEEAVRQADASLAQAKSNLVRQEQLLQEGYVPQSSVDQARRDAVVAESQLRAAQAHLADVVTGATPEQIAEAEALLRQSVAQADQARASQRQADERLAETRISAPISGVVVKRSVDVGQTVIGGSGVGGTLVITVAQIDPLQATVNVDETDIAGIRLGMPVRLTADALPDVVVSGRVDQIAAQAQVIQNVTQFAVTVTLLAPPPTMRLGMTVNADFVRARATNVLVVPQEAVKVGNSASVTVVGPGGTLQTRAVQTGVSDGRQVEITDGLTEGEIVFLGYARPQPAPPGGRAPFSPQFQPRQQQRPGGPGR
ncbi:MAG TPA: efflux RND transporter periplasmic adaptor subunit [bacterium]|nr:efflux RND transporter periplasmic adaptor subunit [bacterium]